MEINRNQYFLAGLVLLFLGVQFRMIDAVVLTPQCAKLLGRETGTPVATAGDSTVGLVRAEATASAPSRDFQPPEWLSWALISVGAVLILHSWAMPRPS